MLRLYLTRHGQTEWNITSKMQGWADSPLTAIGKEEANVLAEHLKMEKFDAIYSSPSGRAYDTANIVKGTRKLEIIKDERLREMNIGIWEGQTKEFLIQKYQSKYLALWKAPHLFVPIDGESFQDVQQRTKLFLDDLQKRYSSGTILIVTHFCTLKLMLAVVKGVSLDKLWDPPRIVNTSLSIIDIMDDGQMTLSLEGDTSHFIVNKA